MAGNIALTCEQHGTELEKNLMERAPRGLHRLEIVTKGGSPEHVWAKGTRKKNQVIVQNIPMFNSGIASGDTVEVKKRPKDSLLYVKVVKDGPNFTFGLTFKNTLTEAVGLKVLRTVTKNFVAENAGDLLWAVAVPKDSVGLVALGILQKDKHAEVHPLSHLIDLQEALAVSPTKAVEMIQQSFNHQLVDPILEGAAAVATLPKQKQQRTAKRTIAEFTGTVTRFVKQDQTTWMVVKFTDSDEKELAFTLGLMPQGNLRGKKIGETVTVYKRRHGVDDPTTGYEISLDYGFAVVHLVGQPVPTAKKSKKKAA